MPLEVWWLVVAPQDGDPAMALQGWPPGSFLVAARARSQVIVLLAAWEIPSALGTPTLARGFPEKEACPPVTAAALVVGNGFPRARGTSPGAVAVSGTQAAQAVVAATRSEPLACGLVETSGATTPGRDHRWREWRC